MNDIRKHMDLMETILREAREVQLREAQLGTIAGAMLGKPGADGAAEGQAQTNNKILQIITNALRAAKFTIGNMSRYQNSPGSIGIQVGLGQEQYDIKVSQLGPPVAKVAVQQQQAQQPQPVRAQANAMAGGGT